jgi:2-C-methyl-D-erythritol 2,4-cyclodiphosphate synthase
MSAKFRVGMGYDVHALVAGRKLVLGGVTIPFEKGLKGWSDADVLAHAIIDALLGAVALGDIGKQFPPGDPAYKDISSLVLLRKAKAELARKGWKVSNIDATVVAEEPHLQGHIGQMQDKLSRTLGIDASQISIKACTSEKMGFVGRGEGIAAYAVALVEAE